MNIGLKSIIAAVLSCAITSVAAQTTNVISKVYTFDADFNEGTAVNLNYSVVANQLQLNANLTTFPYIWIALSNKGTVVKVDTETGKILGEYYTAPDWRGRNPSRTTVDQNGNVWVGNRNEAENNTGSVTHIGLAENFQCVDRNGNGQIDTSTGLGDVKPWTNKDGVDNQGGITTAEDECILHYVRAGNGGTRSVSITPDNNVWVAGINGTPQFALIAGDTGTVVETIPMSCGGYGGLVDKNGVLWSSGRSTGQLLRYDPATKQAQCLPSPDSYGLAIDTQGNIWNCRYSPNVVVKVANDGKELLQGKQLTCRGLAVNPADNHVWIANSGYNQITRLDNDGNELAVINLNQDEGWGPNKDKGWQPTGVAIDARGKVWITNLDSDNAMRIDPATNTVDLVVDLGAGAGPYNYSDMTGTIALGNTDPQGRWMVVYDSNQLGTAWKTISWISQDNGGKITVRSRSEDTQAGLGKQPFVETSNGIEINPPLSGRFLQLEVILRPAQDGISPILEEISVTGIGTGEIPPAQPVITAKTIELCTAIDGSSSITDPLSGGDPLNFQKQLDGLANAIQDPAVFPKDGTVTISVVQFSGTPQLEVPPTLIDSQATADAVAAQVRGIQQFPISTGTDIGGAITFCTDQFKFTSEKQIIDVSTDGQSNASTAASNAIAKGVDAINALGVGTGVDQAQLTAMVRPQPICTTTGQTNCGFVSLIQNFDQYATAIKRKIMMETGGTYVADRVECGETKEEHYTIPLEHTGFYIVEAALPTNQPPGVWSLLVDTMSISPFRSRGTAIPYPGGFYAGVALRENGLSPSWIGFSVGETEAVEVTVSDFLKNHPSLDLKVIRQVGNNWLTIFKQPSAVPEKNYVTPLLQPGFYAVVITGELLSPRGQLGTFIKGNTLYGAVTGGWIDHEGGGYSAFSTKSSNQIADVRTLFCDSYGEFGAGKPAVQVLYIKADGTKEVFWQTE